MIVFIDDEPLRPDGTPDTEPDSDEDEGLLRDDD